MKTFRDITEVKSKGVTFTFGRFNPPTAGHMKLADRLKSVGQRDDVFIYTSHSSDPKKNPLTFAQKRKFMNAMLPRGVKVARSDARNVFDVANDLYSQGYREVKMVVGSDRIQEFQNLLKKYNGVKARHGYYNFQSIEIVSAGERDPDAEGIEGMSASKMRALAATEQEQEFLAALPKKFRMGKQLYKAVRKGMGLKEDFPNFMYEILEAERTPRKKGQHRGSSSHSDLYTDENPKGTIHGLGFKDAATAKKGIGIINKARRTHAHKVQATLVMQQRAKEAIKRTKDPEKKDNLKAALEIWTAHLEKLKQKTKDMKEYYEWGTDKGREWAQSFTPGQPIMKYVKRLREAEDLPKDVLKTKEKYYKELKKKRKDFEDRYGKEKADGVMHATAMNMAKDKHGISN
tara:strand:- start:140 stop:1348 length:1209 start_codon:yes stop_codon:yes gene_type:complete